MPCARGKDVTSQARFLSTREQVGMNNGVGRYMRGKWPPLPCYLLYALTADCLMAVASFFPCPPSRDRSTILLPRFYFIEPRLALQALGVCFWAAKKPRPTWRTNKRENQGSTPNDRRLMLPVKLNWGLPGAGADGLAGSTPSAPISAGGPITDAQTTTCGRLGRCTHGEHRG